MTISYKQTSIHFEVYGKGETLVLLHGFLEDGGIWAPFIPKFSETHQVVVIDLFGHGKTGKVGAIHTMEEMAEAVNEILQSLNISSVSFFGHSMGGYVALAFAEIYPSKTKNLYLLNSTSEADSELRKVERNRAISLVRANKNVFIRMAIGNLFAPNLREKLQNEVESLILNALKLPEETIVASIEGMKIRKDRSSVLKEFKGRKILFAGKLDPIIPFENSVKIANLTKCELVPLPGGHMGFLEDRELILLKTRIFLSWH